MTGQSYSYSQPEVFEDELEEGSSYEEVVVEDDNLNFQAIDDISFVSDENLRQRLLAGEESAGRWECNFNNWPPKDCSHPFDESSATPRRKGRDESETEIVAPFARGSDPPGFRKSSMNVHDPPPQPSMMPQEQPSSLRRISEARAVPQGFFVAQSESATAPAVVSTHGGNNEDDLHSITELCCYQPSDDLTMQFASNRPEGAGSETSNKTKPERKLCCMTTLFLILYTALLVGGAACVYFFVLERDEVRSTPTMAPTMSEGPNPTPFDPYQPDNGCEEISDQVQPHVISQCACSGQVTTLTNSTIARYETLRDEWLVPNVYASWAHHITSCHPANQALLWLSTGCKVDESKLLQRYTMAHMFFANIGQDWISRKGWITQGDVCTWEGLGCTSENELFMIDLPNNGLMGELTSELGLLQSLEVLVLSRNALNGTLPTELAGLPALAMVELSRNTFMGSLPSEIGTAAPKLQLLGISGNKFSGSVASELGKATQLQVLDLSSNEFEGELPALNRLTSLSFLSFAGNSLITGHIPSEWGQLTNLGYLSISDTSIRSKIPREYGSLSKLQNLFIANTQVGGSIPGALVNMTSLQQLDLSGSRFRRSLPASIIQGLGNLENLSLHNNTFTGTLPPELGLLTNLSFLSVNNNKFSGTVPTELGVLTSLEILTLHDNMLTGSVPDEICSLRAMQLDIFTTQCRSKDQQGDQIGVLCPVPACCSACIKTTDAALPSK